MGTIQSSINTLWNIRFGFIGHGEMMAENGKTVMKRPSRFVVRDRSWVCRVKDEADHGRAFTNLEMIKEAVKTIGSNGFIIVQRNNIMAFNILSRNVLTNW